MKKIQTKLGDMYLSLNSFKEVVIHDSKGSPFFTFIDIHDEQIINDTLNAIKNYEKIEDLYELSFCKKIHYSTNMWEIILDINIEWETDDEFSEINLIGEHYVKFDY